MDDFRDITLPVSGQLVRVSLRPFKVLDNVAAFDLVGGDAKNPIRLMAAKIALMTSYPNGARVVYEDILEWNEDDLGAVMAVRDDPTFTPSPGGPSSPSPASPAGV